MTTTQPRSSVLPNAPAVAAARDNAREWRFVTALVVVVLLLTATLYVFAYTSAPDDKQFMGIPMGVEDHAQYFAWMRDLSSANLASNRLTSEPNEPAFFNLLWWATGQLGAVTGLSYLVLFQILRVLAVCSCLAVTYAFFRLALPERAYRRVALLLFTFGGGLGVIWIVFKYLLPNSGLFFPLDIYTVEANTFVLLLGYPHFTLALALLVATFGLVLQALEKKSYRLATIAGIVALVLGLQHAYDLVTIYAVLGLFGLLTWLRDRRFPTFLFYCGLIVVGISAPPAAYSFLLVKLNPVWGEVLGQFDNAGVFTPNLLHLPILLGIPFLLALAAFRPRMLQSRNDTELFIAAWFVMHLPLAYLPVDFQIHLLLGWQVPITILATITLMRMIVPALTRPRLQPVVVRSGDNPAYLGARRSVWQLVGRRRGARAVIIAAVLVLAALTNVYYFAWRFVDLGRYQAPYYLTTDEVAALDWLRDHTTRDDVVLASLDVGQFVPMWSDSRSFLAHWANTLDYFGKIDQVHSVLAADTPAAERRAILDAHAVSYLIVRTERDPQPLFDPTSVEYLEPAFAQGAVTVYRVVR